MPNNQRNTTNATETISPATFPLFSIESRAAARAIVEQQRSQSIVIDLSFLTRERAREVLGKVGIQVPADLRKVNLSRSVIRLSP